MPAHAPLYPDPEIRILTCQRTVLAQWNHANLCAPYWRFYWNPRPGGAVQFGRERQRLDPRHGMVIPPNTAFASTSRGETEQFYLHFLAGPPYDTVAPALFIFAVSRDLREVLEQLSRMIDVRNDRERRHRAVLLQYAACHALRHVPDEKLGVVLTDERVRQATARLEEDLKYGVPNDTLADAAHMNTNAFIRLFKQQTATTPHAYLQRKRIERACILLHTTDASIDEIAEEMGFCDRYHFSKIFKKAVGQGPAAFRRARW